METYTCTYCNEIFETNWSDEEALAEYEESDIHIPDAETEILCDICYKEFMGWFKQDDG